MKNAHGGAVLRLWTSHSCGRERYPCEITRRKKARLDETGKLQERENFDLLHLGHEFPDPQACLVQPLL